MNYPPQTTCNDDGSCILFLEILDSHQALFFSSFGRRSVFFSEPREEGAKSHRSGEWEVERWVEMLFITVGSLTFPPGIVSAE